MTISIITDSTAIAQQSQSATQWTAKEAFLNLPNDIVPLISKSARFEMVEYYAVDSIYAAKNHLHGISQIDTLTNNFIKVKVNESASLSLKLLENKKGTKFVAAVYTFFGPTADSKLYFLNENMEILDTEKFFKTPKLKEFFSIPKGSITKISELEEMITVPTIEYLLDADSNDLTLKLTAGELISQDDYNIMKLFMLPGITYHWDNNKYKKVKNNK